MTSEQARQGRRVVALAILVTVALLFSAIAAVGPQLAGDVAAGYGQPEYRPEHEEYCPGDVLRVTYRVDLRATGPVEIMGAWCSISRGNCLLNDTTIRHGVIVEPLAPISTTLAVTVPHSVQLTPGSAWQYVRSVRRLGQSQFEMFTVPFTVGQGCN